MSHQRKRPGALAKPRAYQNRSHPQSNRQHHADTIASKALAYDRENLQSAVIIASDPRYEGLVGAWARTYLARHAKDVNFRNGPQGCLFPETREPASK